MVLKRSCKIICSIGLKRGTLPLASPCKGSKLLQNKSQEPAGSDYPFFRPILHILFKACSIVSFSRPYCIFCTDEPCRFFLRPLLHNFYFYSYSSCFLFIPHHTELIHRIVLQVIQYLSGIGFVQKALTGLLNLVFRLMSGRTAYTTSVASHTLDKVLR